MKRLILVFFLVVAFILQTHTAYPLYEQSHEAINEYVANNSIGGFSLDTYLKERLGISGGTQEKFNGEAAWFWIKNGGSWEDVPVWYMPYLRSVNHFHNPLTERGFGGIWGTSILSGMSSIQWALLPPNTQSPGGYYSWWDVRNYFFKALTPSTEADRQKFYAETFRGLGQLTHLIQDASVPAHTRDDGHLFYNYETFVRNRPYLISGSIIPSNTLQGIEKLIDTNQYTGPNPIVGTSIGLSEFTNANFFSEDTIFTERLFPHPAKADTNMAILEQMAEDGVLDKVSYVIHNALGHRLAAASYFRFYDPDERLLEYRWYYHLDDAVYADYASHLIPRAVGYSAALINYFFRGEVEIAEIEEQRDANQAITGLKFKVKNLTSDEEMKDGEVWIAYRYKKPGETAFTYGLSQPISSGSLPYQSEAPYEVSFPTSGSIPSDATDTQYTYVFKGTLGAEQGAVVGKVLPGDADVVFDVRTWGAGGLTSIPNGTLTYRIKLDRAAKTFSLIPQKAKIVEVPVWGVGEWDSDLFYMSTRSYEEDYYGLAVDGKVIYGVNWGKQLIKGAEEQVQEIPIPQPFMEVAPKRCLSGKHPPVHGVFYDDNTSGSGGSTSADVFESGTYGILTWGAKYIDMPFGVDPKWFFYGKETRDYWWGTRSYPNDETIFGSGSSQRQLDYVIQPINLDWFHGHYLSTYTEDAEKNTQPYQTIQCKYNSDQFIPSHTSRFNISQARDNLSIKDLVLDGHNIFYVEYADSSQDAMERIIDYSVSAWCTGDGYVRNSVTENITWNGGGTGQSHSQLKRNNAVLASVSGSFTREESAAYNYTSGTSGSSSIQSHYASQGNLPNIKLLDAMSWQDYYIVIYSIRETGSRYSVDGQYSTGSYYGEDSSSSFTTQKVFLQTNIKSIILAESQSVYERSEIAIGSSPPQFFNRYRWPTINTSHFTSTGKTVTDVSIGIGKKSLLGVVRYTERDVQTKVERVITLVVDLKDGTVFTGENPPYPSNLWGDEPILVR